jgi:hypothetical protein
MIIIDTTRPAVAAIAGLCFLTFARVADSYSVLTHEAVVDTAWEPSIKPLLLKRYPTASEEQLREAHAYVYGGCIVQDMGYYPFGSHFFSNLTHYVRSGDFIRALLEESRDMYEYAFALGALAHYASDNTGHPMAINLSVPMEYPKLAARYGHNVTYQEDPKAHLLVEFSFDVVQVAGSGYLPETYHNFIGFKVSKPVLERALKRTYGLSLPDLFKSEDLAIGTYRRAASEIIPQMTRIAWKKRREQILKLRPEITRQGYIYSVSRAQYEAKWNGNYSPHLESEWNRYSTSKIFGRPLNDEGAKPGLLARFLVFIFRIVPKVGPFRTLAFKVPSPAAERLFTRSVTTTVARYHDFLSQESSGSLKLKNLDFDTGNPTKPGEYKLADETYSKLIDRLAQQKFEGVTPELRTNIEAFYTDAGAPNATKENPERWKKTLDELEVLRSGAAQSSPPGR